MEVEKSSLPETVTNLIAKICEDQKQPPITDKAKKLLAEIGEVNALFVLRKIASKSIDRSFSGYIVYLINMYRSSLGNGVWSPNSSPVKRPWSPSPTPPSGCLHKMNGETPQSPQTKSKSMLCGTHPPLNRQLSFEEETQQGIRPGDGHSAKVHELMRILNGLEFRKLFLVLSYMGKRKLEDVLTLYDANDILSIKDLCMPDFESQIWNSYGIKYSDPSNRSQNYDWDSGKAHLYYCIHDDKGYYLKGPCLNSTRTHLQRSLGDDNVLIVKFLGDETLMRNIAQEGIIVGQRHYKFFVFKDERKIAKTNDIEENKKLSGAVKCYFVHADSGKSIIDVRRRFMHVHTLQTVEKYMARFSLILSKTIKLQVDFGAVQIRTIDDIPFRDKDGSIMHDKDGNVLIHTDGTGYVSEDLAIKCPKDFAAAMYIKNNSIEEVSCHKRARNNEPPLLMQCRLFYNGYAVKGTLLLNKKLENGTIQIRPSMIKVKRDETLPEEDTFNSLEIVSVSRRPGCNYLSKNLIALLSYGGVPHTFFLDLLTSALEDTRNIYSNRRAALRVASNHDGWDYGFVAQRMVSSGIPLNEPYLQYCLSKLEKDGKGKLKEGKIPICDSFYLMGTSDPTGLLKNDEVCVIFDHGPIMGKVLVYRNPGLHFGDIHVMNAVYKKELEDYIGNSRFAIFFSTQGSSSAAYEMATGDFDGDMYWVSKNTVLLKTFEASEPWKPDDETQDSNCRKLQPSKLPDSSLELEHELFRLYLEARKPSFNMATACHSWLSFMDRLLILRDESEKKSLKKKMNRLINIYYDALDAPKSGKRVNVPSELTAEMYPHYMKKAAELTYHSTSILGKIHDRAEASEETAVPKQEFLKLPCFDVPIPCECVSAWKDLYGKYRKDMTRALDSGSEVKSEAANHVIEKYKMLLYGADEFEESRKNTEEIYMEALAIYHVTYDHAMEHGGDISKCSFAWKVAGSALYSLYAFKTVAASGSKEKPLVILPSLLREVL